MAACSDSGTPRRLHSNTISGARPPNIDTSLPHHVRRNSEGSPRLPPPINISAPTPTTPLESTSLGMLSLDHFPSDKHNDKHSSRSASPVPTPVVGPETPAAATAVPPRLIPQAKKSRSRGSSVSTTHTVEKTPHTSSSSTHSGKNPRRGSNNSDDSGTSSDGGGSALAGSVASACGVELADDKRNREFHALFRSVPEDDPLIEDFGCALQKEILLQGRIYISENHLCFNANIFGWVTNLVIAFTDIVDIEKRFTAYVIPNAIQISTLHAKHFFASFLSRDQAYDMLVDVWRCARPFTAQTSNGESCLQDEDDMDESGSYDETDTSYTGTETDINDDDDDDDEPADDFTAEDTKQKDDEGGHGRQSSLASLPLTQGTKKEGISEAARRRALSEGTRPRDLAMSRDNSKASHGNAASDGGVKPKVAQVHEKTECKCSGEDKHFSTTVMDKTYKSSLAALYELLYSDDKFMKGFLTDNQKTRELEMGEWKKVDDKESRNISYIKPLNSSLGPKETKCELKEEVESCDLDHSVSVMTTTQTPDVPSGGSFSVKTRVCMTWAGKGQVRVLVTVLVDFTKSSWLKSTIEKASIDGQNKYYADLDTALRKHLEAGTRGTKSGRRKKGRRRRRHDEPKTRKDTLHEPSEKSGRSPFALLSTAASGCVGWLVDNTCFPSTAQLTMTCMFLMVLINLFIAGKMADVERQLDQLGSTTLPSILAEHQVHHLPNEDEANELWDWLGRMDPGRERRSARATQAPPSRDPDHQQDAWDRSGFQHAEAAKDRLDEYMTELSKMVQRAGQSMDQVNKVIVQQKERIQREMKRETSL